jgi:hypothetical protein
MTDIFDPEELFPPKAGGMVDTARKKTAADASQLAAYNAAQDAPVAGTPYGAVRVRPEAPDAGTIRTVTLSEAYPVARLLPADPGRRTAVVLAIDNDVYVTGSQGLANDVAGTATAGQVGYFPAGIGLPIDNQGEWWVAATTTAGNTRVTIISNRDSKS